MLMPLKVGYQGNHGTFSEIAVMRYFEGQDIEQVSFTNFPDIMKSCESGELDYALIPVENTTTGMISRTYDLFKNHKVMAVGEIIVRIRQDLIVLPGTKPEEIREVYSHPEALSQCQEFFRSHPNIRAVAYQDTARSVEYVRQCGDHSKAALGSARASEYYRMESLLSGVQDSDTNMTRFLCIAAKEEIPDDADKVSIMLVLNHEPGALYHAMGILAYNDINIVKLESRPIPDEPFHYCFYLDFAGSLNDPFVRTALLKLKEHSIETRVLGCYKAAQVD